MSAPASEERTVYWYTESAFHIYEDCPVLAADRAAQTEVKTFPCKELDEFQEEWIEKHGKELPMCVTCIDRVVGWKRDTRDWRECFDLPGEYEETEDDDDDELGREALLRDEVLEAFEEDDEIEP